MIIRNYANSSACLFKTADNRSQTTDHGPQRIVVTHLLQLAIICELSTVYKKMVHR
jgi:hypothetical protein